jgi:hypothetical protein
MTWPGYLRHEVIVDGVIHRLTPKLAELAFLLLVRRGHFVPMNDIVEFLWPDPDLEPDFSEDVIRTYASRLRRVLPADSIVWRATSCTDLMEPGHYLNGAMMLEREKPDGKQVPVTSLRKVRKRASGRSAAKPEFPASRAA